MTHRRLSAALYVLGGLLLAGAAFAALSGVLVALVPQLLVGGLLVVVGLAVERWRYKPMLEGRPDPAWIESGERFIDPGSGQLIAVYFDPRSGDRHYLIVASDR